MAARRISATEAKNNFGGLLDLVAELGRVEITKHGRVVAVVLAPRLGGEPTRTRRKERWGSTHMIPPELARAARIVRRPKGFDEP